MVKPFAVRHFTVLQYFEFCPVESDEKCFECYAWISTYTVYSARPEKLRGTLLSLLIFIIALTECSVNAGNSWSKKILYCGNFSLRFNCLKFDCLGWGRYRQTPSKEEEPEAHFSINLI